MTSQMPEGQPAGWSPPPPQGWPQAGHQRRFDPPVAFRAHEGPMLSERSTGLATSALVWGLVAFCTAWIPVIGMFALAPGIFALQRGIANAIQRRAGRGMGITGAIFGGLGSLNALWIPWVSLFVIPALLSAATVQ